MDRGENDAVRILVHAVPAGILEGFSVELIVVDDADFRVVGGQFPFCPLDAFVNERPELSGLEIGNDDRDAHRLALGQERGVDVGLVLERFDGSHHPLGGLLGNPSPLVKDTVHRADGDPGLFCDLADGDGFCVFFHGHKSSHLFVK